MDSILSDDYNDYHMPGYARDVDYGCKRKRSLHDERELSAAMTTFQQVGWEIEREEEAEREDEYLKGDPGVTQAYLYAGFNKKRRAEKAKKKQREEDEKWYREIFLKKNTTTPSTGSM